MDCSLVANLLGSILEVHRRNREIEMIEEPYIHSSCLPFCSFLRLICLPAPLRVFVAGTKGFLGFLIGMVIFILTALREYKCALQYYPIQKILR